MPTITQLPPISSVNPSDELPLSQGGVTGAVSVGTLLAGTQSTILVPTGSLLGRNSLGAGTPEPVSVGNGLLLSGGTLTATAGDVTVYPVETDLDPNDQAVVSNNGVAKLVGLPLLRGLFSAGANIAIDASGTISATAPAQSTTDYSITALPTTTSIAATDLVAISQAGADCTIAYENFLDGQTIDMAQPAQPAGDTDTFWVAQGGSTMLRQTFAAIWNWVAAKLPSYKRPVVEITVSTTLDGTVHNGAILICSQPVTLMPAFVNMGNGFSCDLLNLSGGSVTLGAGIVTSSSSQILPNGQSASLRAASFSGGNVVFAAMSGVGTGNGSGAAPGQVTNLTASGLTTTSLVLAWSPPSSGGTPSTYVVQFRPTGSATWNAASAATAAQETITGLASGTQYDFTVLASNAAGTGLPSSVFNATTLSAPNTPGQVTGLAATNPSSSGLTLVWNAPASGGPVSSYTVQYRASGTTTWSTYAAGVIGTTENVTGLSGGTSYDFQVIAQNSSGAGAASSSVTATTAPANPTVASIVWNLVPSGSYPRGSGSIGINAHISPANAPVQFGFATSGTVPPASWTAGQYVNSDLWGAYVSTPSTPGNWYVWCSGTDGSLPTPYPTPFAVT